MTTPNYPQTGQPMADPMAQPMGQPMPEPMAQPMSQPMADPMAQPMSQPMADPMAQPMPQPMMPQPQMQPQPVPMPMQQPMAAPMMMDQPKSGGSKKGCLLIFMLLLLVALGVGGVAIYQFYVVPKATKAYLDSATTVLAKVDTSLTPVEASINQTGSTTTSNNTYQNLNSNTFKTFNNNSFDKFNNNIFNSKVLGIDTLAQSDTGQTPAVTSAPVDATSQKLLDDSSAFVSAVTDAKNQLPTPNGQTTDADTLIRKYLDGSLDLGTNYHDLINLLVKAQPVLVQFTAEVDKTRFDASSIQTEADLDAVIALQTKGVTNVKGFAAQIDAIQVAAKIEPIRKVFSDYLNGYADYLTKSSTALTQLKQALATSSNALLTSAQTGYQDAQKTLLTSLNNFDKNLNSQATSLSEYLKTTLTDIKKQKSDINDVVTKLQGDVKSGPFGSML